MISERLFAQTWSLILLSYLARVNLCVYLANISGVPQYCCYLSTSNTDLLEPTETNEIGLDLMHIIMLLYRHVCFLSMYMIKRNSLSMPRYVSIGLNIAQGNSFEIDDLLNSLRGCRL